MARARTPLRSAAPSLEASNQSQIDDLVQRNRILELANKKQADESAAIIQKSKDSTLLLQKQWQAGQAEWRHGCDILQSCHRIVQLRSVVEAEKERMNVLKEMDVTRMEKLKRLQRDFRITMFQAREIELEERISELEEEREALVVEHADKIRRLQGKHAQYIAQVQAKQDEHAVVDQERQDLEVSDSVYLINPALNPPIRAQDQLTKSNDENARLLSSVNTLNSKLERTTLKLEGVQTKCADLERTNAELARTNADVCRQLEKWQELETKGGTEAESLRKRCMELELQLKEVETRLEDANEENEHVVGKERRRVEKLKGKVAEWQVLSVSQVSRSSLTNAPRSKRVSTNRRAIPRQRNSQRLRKNSSK